MRISSVAGKVFLLVVPLWLIAWRWIFDPVRAGMLMENVPSLIHLSWLDTPYAYLFLHLFTVLPVLLFSFDRKVFYAGKWRFLAPAILLPAIPFLIWDVFFTSKGVWGFNEAYTTGVNVFGLPVEEWMFFVSIPFACVFVYECMYYYFPGNPFLKWEPWITPILIVLMFLVAVFRWDHIYSWTTFIAAGFFLAFHWIYLDAAVRGRFYLSFLFCMVPFFMVNGVLTGGYTAEPIVLYNPGEYFGLRLTSIPVDDIVYGFLLLLGNVTLFEFFQKNRVYAELISFRHG